MFLTVCFYFCSSFLIFEQIVSIFVPTLDRVYPQYLLSQASLTSRSVPMWLATPVSSGCRSAVCGCGCSTPMQQSAILSHSKGLLIIAAAATCSPRGQASQHGLACMLIVQMRCIWRTCTSWTCQFIDMACGYCMHHSCAWACGVRDRHAGDRHRHTNRQIHRQTIRQADRHRRTHAVSLDALTSDCKTLGWTQCCIPLCTTRVSRIR